MASVNGTTGKLAKSDGRRPSTRPVVPVQPVLPITYPQRPYPAASAAPVKAPATPSKQEAVRERGREVETVKEDREPAEDPVVENQQQTQNSENADVQTTSTSSAAPQTETMTVSSASPPASMSKPNGLDTPVAHAIASIASPTPTRRRVAPSLPSFHAANSSIPSPATAGPVHDMAPYPHFTATSRSRPHQPHPSNGSLVFGVFENSNASSPAPSASFAPPPPINMMPYHPGALPPVDGFGHPFIMSPSIDGFPPAVLNHHHGPPTPHSFHGSQASTHPDENGHSQLVTLNGYDGYGTEIAQAPPPLPAVNPPVGPGFFNPNFQIQAEALQFLRNAFHDREFADCTLEVRLLDKASKQNVFRMPAHRFVLSRSPTLRQIIRNEAPSGLIVLELRNEYMRHDATNFTLQTLYGWDLGDGILPHYNQPQNIKEDFGLTLGYLAAARYLQLPPVYHIAIERAKRLMDYETLEQAYKFVFPDIIFSPPGRQGLVTPRDGLNCTELIDCILTFVIHNLPVDFVLDTQTPDGPFARLPVVDSALLSSSTTKLNGPPVVDGTSSRNQSPQVGQLPGLEAQMPRNPRSAANPRLSRIKFGDISPSKQNGNGYAQDSQLQAEHLAARRQPRPLDSALSQILLNLPLKLLKHVLEHPALGKASGEFTAQIRFAVIASIVAEREARRLRALDKRHAQLRHLQEMVERAVEPLVVREPADFWVNNMGFREEVFPGDVPYLVHTWARGDSSSVVSS